MKNNLSILYKLLDSPFIFDIFVKTLGERNRLKKIIKRELDIQKDDKILDLGCGPGDLSVLFSPENYTGTDINQEYINFARKKYNRNFIKMDASDLKFEDNHFDLVFISSLLHHISDELFLKVMSEIKRVTKPTGRVFVFEFSYILNKESLYKWILRKLDRGKYARDYGSLKKIVLKYFNIKKDYLSKSPWGDSAVFLLNKQAGAEK